MQHILELESAFRLNTENIKSLQKDNNKLKRMINTERRKIVDFYISQQEKSKDFNLAESMNQFHFEKVNTGCDNCIDESGICNGCKKLEIFN